VRIDSTKGELANISLGDRTLEGYMLPSGQYCMSLLQAAEQIETSPQNATNFLRSKAIKSLLGEDYTDQEIENVQVVSQGQLRGGARIKAVPLEVVSAFWLWQAFRGNKKALALCMALLTETLEQRFDAAFGVQRGESERNQRLQAKLGTLEGDLEKLGEAYALDDAIRGQLPPAAKAELAACGGSSHAVRAD